jgi:hypothetical protein
MELIDELCLAIRTGLTIPNACDKVGVDLSTFHRWQSHAEQNVNEPLFAIFARGVSAAKRFRITGLEEVVVDAANTGDWRAAMRLLEAYHPKRFAPRVAVHVEQELSDALEKLKRGLSPDEYKRAVAALAEEPGGEGVGGDPPEGTGSGPPPSSASP